VVSKAMPEDIRIQNYWNQNGCEKLTPAQRRRVKQKANNTNRGTRRRAHADVKRADQNKRRGIRQMFTVMRGR